MQHVITDNAQPILYTQAVLFLSLSLQQRLLAKNDVIQHAVMPRC